MKTFLLNKRHSKLFKHFQLQKLYVSSQHDYTDNKEAEAVSLMTKNPKKLLWRHISSSKRWYLLLKHAFSYLVVYFVFYFKSFYIKQGIKVEYKIITC